MIARIVAATTLCPTGKFVYEEGAVTEAPTEGDDPENPPYAAPPAAALSSASGWVTRYAGILDIGRCTNPPSEEEEAEEDGDKPKGPEKQAEILPLTPIAPAEWTTDTYTHGGPSVAISRSVCWPGAFCAYQLVGAVEKLASLYIGYGHEALLNATCDASVPFRMEAPPPFETEPEELVEQEDAPLAVENEAWLAAKTAEVAEEAATMPDPPEGEEGY